MHSEKDSKKKGDLENKIQAQLTQVLQEAAKQNGWSIEEEIEFQTQLIAKKGSLKSKHPSSNEPNSENTYKPTQTRQLIYNRDTFLDILHDVIRDNKREMLVYQINYENDRSELLNEINKLDSAHKETLDYYSNLELDLKDISRKVRGRTSFNLKLYITYETLEDGKKVPINFELENLGRKTIGFNKERVYGSYGIEKQETYTSYIQPPNNFPKPKK